MSNPLNALRSLLRQLGVVGPARVRASEGTGAGGRVLPKHVRFSLPALVLAALVFISAPALAAAPEQPEAFPPTEVKATTATLHGVLDPLKEGGPFEFGTYEFVYRQSPTECKGAGEVKTTEGLSLGGGKEEVSQGIEALSANTQYTACLVAHNEAKTESATSPPVTFKTALPPEAPETTSPAASVTAASATLEGVLNPNQAGDAGTYEFLYRVSPTECEGERASPTEPPGVMSGAAKQAVSVPVSALQPNAHYMFCLLARNAAGETAVGPAVPFTTPTAQPSIESETVSSVTATGARLEGVVNPNNQATECEFQYGAEPSLATSTTVACEPSLLGGFGGQGVGVTVSGLEAKTTYYYRVLATNGAGTNEGAIEHFTTPTPPEPPTTTSPATAITTTSATLEGVLNPGGGGEAGSYEFVYRQSATECQRTNPETGQPETENATPTTTAPAGTDAVTADVEGLAPGAQYTFCLLSRNEAGETALGAPVTFRTLAVLPTITGTSATEVTATAATLNAQINPGGAETTYHFEYDTAPYTTGAPHGQSTPESPSIGADNSLHPVTAAVQGLQPNTLYHYRVVATNPQSPAGGTDGPDETFTTEPTGGAFALPDGRAYEQVSPPQKDGAEVLGIGGGAGTVAGGGVTEASEDGTGVTYLTSAPVGANPPGNTLSTQMLSARGAGGWSSLDIATPHEHSVEAAPPRLQFGEEFLRFSSDLSHALLMPLYGPTEPPLAPEIHQEVGGETEIYLRNNATNTFQAVITSEPLEKVNFEGATPDLSHVVFGGPAGLDPNYPNAEGLYEWAGGQTRLVSVLPDHEPASGRPVRSIGEATFEPKLILGSTSVVGILDVSATRHAISDDGTRVVWSDVEGHLFTRNMVSGETTLIGAGGFQAASSDGSRVFFSNGDLIVFDVADMTQVDLGAAGTVVGANDEGTMVYETSPAVLTTTANAQGEKATEGARNLYLLRETAPGSGSWSTTFITGAAEVGSKGREGSAAETLQRQAERVSPNGRFLAFMSRRSLTGYDNRDAISGEPDEEVYWYDAESNRLVCASCDPSGARPVGQYDTEAWPGLAIDPPRTWMGRWLAAVVPGWTQNGSIRSTGHQPRYLSDSGRMFFSSSDALVPRDVNGRDDVYEYEPVGVGSCRPPSYGQGASVVFNEKLGGCIGLMSAGTGNTESLFFDASASGNDVFFTTEDGLVSQDKDGTADMYDARVCTSAEPCPSSLAVPPACTTTDSCRAAPSPQPGVFGAPASATFAGAGNATPTPSATKKASKKKTVRCGKGKKRRHGRCVKAKKKRHKAKRSRNDRRAGR